MGTNHSLRLGVITIQNSPWEKLVKRWKYIDGTFFDSLWVADHFTHWKEKEMTFFECWTTLCGMACETSRIRIGTAVTNMHWRHPAWLAKQALTVDHLSNGRLNLGLGVGGASSLEYSMTGFEKGSPKDNVERFKEYTDIVDQLLRNPLTTFQGNYYKLEDAIVMPDSIQKPRPPIYIGAKGRKMLKITAKFADAWNTLESIDSLDEGIKRVKERNSILDKYCDEIDRDPKTLRRTLGVYENEAMHNIGNMKIYENLELLEEVIKKFYEIGMTEIFIVYPFKQKEIPNFEFFAKEILPELKEKYSQ
jgi:alkanesulfonate monooxygenase SsuD/methylene tetrahydromethanopterin reductase-like flavin-dependent oxidoreductase (luciferase family)